LNTGLGKEGSKERATKKKERKNANLSDENNSAAHSAKFLRIFCAVAAGIGVEHSAL
jgi:hypothetical protein